MSTYPLTEPDTINIDISRYYTLTYYPPGNLYKFLPNDNVGITLTTKYYTFNGGPFYHTSTATTVYKSYSFISGGDQIYTDIMAAYTHTDPLYYAFDWDALLTNGVGNVNYNQNVATTLSEHTSISAKISDYNNLSAKLMSKTYFSTILKSEKTSFIVNMNNITTISQMYGANQTYIWYENPNIGFHLVAQGHNLHDAKTYTTQDNYGRMTTAISYYYTNIDALEYIDDWHVTVCNTESVDFYSFFTRNNGSFTGTKYNVSMTINRYSETKNTYYGYKTNGAQTNTYSIENG